MAAVVGAMRRLHPAARGLAASARASAGMRRPVACLSMSFSSTARAQDSTKAPIAEYIKESESPLANLGDPNASKMATDPVVKQLVGQILQLNLMQVVQLVEELNEKMGGTPGQFMGGGMPMMMMGGGGGGSPAGGSAGGAPAAAPAAAAEPPAPAAPAKTSFDVILKAFDAKNKLKVIKEVRTITNLGLKEAKDLVEAAPQPIKKGVKKEEADDIVAKLKEAGAEMVVE